MNFYDLEINKADGSPLKMSAFKGKTLLIVNTATQCGLTPQFKGLEDIYQKYKDKGLVILGFPCNQFGGQEPLKNEDMERICQINHGVTFQLTEKVDVNGKNTTPVFKFLKKNLSGLFGSSIKWNFTKFLISSDGTPIKRYSPRTKPKKMEKEIKKLLQQNE